MAAEGQMDSLLLRRPHRGAREGAADDWQFARALLD
jgi:hypothetical protein